MSASSNNFFYANINYVDSSNVSNNYINFTHNTNNSLDLSENSLSKYARGFFFSPNYNKQFFDAINWANNLGDYKTQLNLINPFNNSLMNIDLLNNNVPSIKSSIIDMSPINGEHPGDSFGFAVACNADGTVFAASGPFNDGNAYPTNTSVGHVRVYKWNGNAWDQMGADIDGDIINGGHLIGYSSQALSLNSDGTILAIGADRHEGPGNDSGDVIIFDYVQGRTPSEWKQLGNIMHGEATYDYSGSTVSLNNDGTIVAIGARVNDGYDDRAGHVRIYDYVKNRVPKEWDQMGDDIDGTTFINYFGGSVSLNGDGNIVAGGGIYGKDNNDVYTGNVRVYDYVETRSPKWQQLGDDICGDAEYNYFGECVSLSSDGTIVAIGAWGNDGVSTDPNDNRGHVRVYDYVETRTPKWDKLGSAIVGEDAGDNFGFNISLSADGTILAIGAKNNDGGGNNSGHVRVYQYIDNDWEQIDVDIDGEDENYQSGHSVALSKNGSVLVVGEPYNNINGTNSGRVFTYEII